MSNEQEPQIFPQPYPSAPCDIFNCRTRAKWFIGKQKPTSTWNLCLRVCEDCIKKILAEIPEELKQYLPGYAPPEGMALVTKEQLSDYALLQDKLTAAGRENELFLSRIAELEAKPKKEGAS